MAAAPEAVARAATPPSNAARRFSSTYDPLYITSKVNSGELIISYVLFAKNRLEDIRNSIRI